MTHRPTRTDTAGQPNRPVPISGPLRARDSLSLSISLGVYRRLARRDLLWLRRGFYGVGYRVVAL